MSETTTHEHSMTMGALAKALAVTQGKIHGAAKTAQNPHLKNKYATLADIWDACRAQLSESGLAVVQTFEPHGKDGVLVLTTLVHESGEWIRSRLFLPVTKADAQGFGSAITYARRYALAAIVGVTPDDDDGEAAVARPGTATTTRVQDAGTVDRAATEAREKDLTALLDAAKSTTELVEVSGKVAAAVKAGELSQAAVKRLRERFAKLTAALGAAA